MPSLHVVLIWFLSALFGGSLLTLGVLYCTRDRGQRAAGTRVSRRDREATQRRWQANLEAARRRLETRSRQPAMAPVRPWNDDGSWAHATCPECGISWDEPSPDCPKITWNAHPLGAVPEHWSTADPAAVATLSQALIGASVRRVYADIEARQVRQLAATAWRSWQG